MRKILFLLAMLPIVLCGCSSDDENEAITEITLAELVGSWATDQDGNTRKYLNFEANGDGYFALFSGTKIILDYTFNFRISGNTIKVSNTYPYELGSYSMTYSYSTNKLKILEGDEKGVYKKMK